MIRLRGVPLEDRRFYANAKGLALALIVWVLATGFWTLALFAFVYGILYGGWVAILPSVVMDCFGGRSISSIMGILFTSVAFGTLIGPTAAGFIFDLSHSYTLPILAGVAANLVACAIAAMAWKTPAPVSEPAE